jgi:predicted tellurium resistance membrane protein TerC
MEALLTPEVFISLVSLTFMEIVLGIDNLVFLSIVSGRLPEEQQPRARRIGLMLALGFRIILLLCISWIVGMVEPVVFGLSWRDIILLVGGLFLLAKATTEVHHKLEGAEESHNVNSKAVTFGSVIFQIVMLDIVFSFDSILTAVGLVDNVMIMIIAVVISMIVMLIFVESISEFIQKHPTMKMLALSFLLLIGFMLVFEGLHSLHHQEIPKGYIYFAMFFSFAVELLNMRIRGNSKEVVELRQRITE